MLDDIVSQQTLRAGFMVLLTSKKSLVFTLGSLLSWILTSRDDLKMAVEII